MPKLSLCIPVDPQHALPIPLVKTLLARPDADLEIILAGFGERLHQSGDVASLLQADRRLKLLPPAPDSLSGAQLWIGTVAAAEGDWVSVVRAQDMIEPDLPDLLSHVEDSQPGADALGWTAFQIAPEASRQIDTSIAIPILHNVTDMEKAPMLEAFFQWKEATQVPRMPFGLYHGAIKRSLLETVLTHAGEWAWLTLLPEYEWAARVLIFANGLAYSNRPLSAVSARPFRPFAVPSAIPDFPLHSGIGLTAAIAEIQARVLIDLGSQWSGFNADFVHACLYDCALENDPTLFQQKCAAYRSALLAMPDGPALASGFQPPYSPVPHSDPRRGLHGKMLLVDRFIGEAANAQDFYRVVRGMLTPVEIVASAGALVVPAP